MPKFGMLWRVPACFVLLIWIAKTPPLVSATQGDIPDPPSLPQATSLGQCAVEPLFPVTDADASRFEAAVGTEDMINTSGLTPRASDALSRFKRLIETVRGRIVVSSAYRPPAYQEHLQQVWDKWMLELRHNRAAGCAILRAEVQQEFSRHGLLESQRPATSSDHTRGLSFDANILLPAGARLRKRKVTIDRLAQMAGVRRPTKSSDPVHFRVI